MRAPTANNHDDDSCIQLALLATGTQIEDEERLKEAVALYTSWN